MTRFSGGARRWARRGNVAMRGSAASFPRLTPPLNLPRRPPDACKTHPESIRARFGSDRCGANAVHGAKSVAEVERQLAFLRAHFAGFDDAALYM